MFISLFADSLLIWEYLKENILMFEFFILKFISLFYAFMLRIDLSSHICK